MKNPFSSLLLPLLLLWFAITPSSAFAIGSVHASGQITGVQTGSVYHYSLTLDNSGKVGDDAINTFWFAWVPGQNFLPSSPSNIQSPPGWVATVTTGGSGDGYGIQWRNVAGIALAIGEKFTQLSFDLTNAPVELAGNSLFHTNTPVGTSFVYSGAPLSGSSAQFVVTNFVSTNGATTPSFVVSNLNDSGIGSLREALVNANTNAASVITFTTNGTITLLNPLPLISKPVTIDGTTAPSFTSNPVVEVNFSSKPGIVFAPGSQGSVISSLSLIGASIAAITLQAPNVTVKGNFVGLTTNGNVSANFGDGVRILAPSSGNLIGNSNPVAGITYNNTTDTNNFTIQPITAWQGIRNNGTNSNNYLICGTSAQTNGLLYIGSINGRGASFPVRYTDTNVVTTTTSVYGPDNLTNGRLRLVGSYRKSSDTNIYNHGFVWEGTTNDLPSGGSYRSIDYPGAKYQFTHSTMGGLAVGNADGPKKVGNKTLPIGPGIAYIADLNNLFPAPGTATPMIIIPGGVPVSSFTTISYPGAKSTTAYGIWYNGGTGYTICGGYSPIATNNLTNQELPLTQGKGYLVDYDAATHQFTHWKSFDYPNGPAKVNFVTHFEGISSTEPGVYTLVADSLQVGSANAEQGSWVSVRRNADGNFDDGQWVDLNADDDSITSANSVIGNQVVGIVVAPVSSSNGPVAPCNCGSNVASPASPAYQATVNIAFQRSNVIGGNRGNGISLNGSKGNVIAMNYIGSDPDGSTNRGFGNGANGILITGNSSGNLIGGQEAGSNNPTGSKNPVSAVFQRPPQGNLISGNQNDGVLINGASQNNLLSGNFIGTDASGLNLLGNGLDGVGIENSKNNSLIGCTLHQNPFVFYNVISGNGRDGVHLFNADNTTVQANFIGIGATNGSLLPNGGDGLSVAGTSKNTQVGGVIPLGNVISGNAHNGISVTDQASGFISFNTFGGVYAFTNAAPNGWNGILITSTGGKNTIRTCILSGNKWNGIQIAGDASGVQVMDTACGTDTDINHAVPNQFDGISIGGTAHGNAIGGFKPSVEERNHFAGNSGYGIDVTDQAHDNVIYNSNVSYGYALTDGAEPSIPNQFGGVLLDQGTSVTVIGGSKPIFGNKISSNIGGGITILASTKNLIQGNAIKINTEYGIYAAGACDRSVIKGNTILNNGNLPADNVDLQDSSGILYVP